jgi:hypothetical protein
MTNSITCILDFFLLLCDRVSSSLILCIYVSLTPYPLALCNHISGRTSYQNKKLWDDWPILMITTRVQAQTSAETCPKPKSQASFENILLLSTVILSDLALVRAVRFPEAVWRETARTSSQNSFYPSQQLQCTQFCQLKTQRARD